MIDFSDLMAIIANEDVHKESVRDEERDNEYSDNDDSEDET